MPSIKSRRTSRTATSDTAKGSQTQRVDSMQRESARRRPGTISSASDITDSRNQNSKPERKRRAPRAPRAAPNAYCDSEYARPSAMASFPAPTWCFASDATGSASWRFCSSSTAAACVVHSKSGAAQAPCSCFCLMFSSRPRAARVSNKPDRRAARDHRGRRPQAFRGDVRQACRPATTPTAGSSRSWSTCESIGM